MKITSDSKGASAWIESMEPTGRTGMGGVEEYEETALHVRLTPDQCIEHALELLKDRVKPGALSVIKHFIRENRL